MGEKNCRYWLHWKTVQYVQSIHTVICGWFKGPFLVEESWYCVAPGVFIGSGGIRLVFFRHCSSRSTADEPEEIWFFKETTVSILSILCTPFFLLPSFPILLSENFVHFTRWSMGDGAVKTSLSEEVGTVHLWWELSTQLHPAKHHHSWVVS